MILYIGSDPFVIHLSYPFFLEFIVRHVRARHIRRRLHDVFSIA
jgi:hypothetical protein